MLVLTRRTDETILIDGRIEIQVVRIKGNTVRIGIRAPEDVKILRGELAPFGKESFNKEPFDKEQEDELIATGLEEGNSPKTINFRSKIAG